jgi:hypothetical protein
MSWKQPPSDITLELDPDSPLTASQLALYDDIRKLYAKYSAESSLRIYVLGYGKPRNLPPRKKSRRNLSSRRRGGR